MSERELVLRVAGVISARLGLQLDDARRLDELGAAIRERLRTASGHEEYVRALDTPDSAELFALAEQLTVSETFFFRNPSQFDALVQLALPERIRVNGASRQLRILSAGCASGDEAFSIAILLRDRAAELAGWDVEVTGIDVSERILSRARSGRFSAWSLRETPAKWRERWFTQRGTELVLDESIRTSVRFDRRNVCCDASWPRSASYDVIFFRNVLMYFTVEAARAAVANAARSLLPGGYLFLGHAETLRGLSDELELHHTHAAFYYRRPSADADRAPGESLASTPFAAGDTSWIETIRAATERIAALAMEERAHETARDVAPSSGLATVFELLRLERYEAALEALAEAPPESREAPRVQLLRAVLLLDSGALADAERAAHELLAMEGVAANAHYVVGLCREHAGDLDGAVHHHRLAIELDVSFAMPYLHIGSLARRGGRRSDARLALTRAAELLVIEAPMRVLLFGGGFSREALVELCRSELDRLGRDE